MSTDEPYGLGALTPAPLVKTNERRGYGTGSLFARTDSAGNESWYGKWRVDGRQVMRKVGPKRTGHSRPGDESLTRRGAEARLREMIATVKADDVARSAERTAPLGGRSITTLWEAFAADRGLALKASTLRDYERCVANWFEPHFGTTPVHRITRDDVQALVAAMQSGRHRKRGDAAGLAAKSIRNYVTLLATLFNYAVRERRWLTENPAALVTVPTDERADTGELRFLRPFEVNDLTAAAAAAPVYGLVDRVLFLAAAMSGLRQGELLALRWESVDFAGGRLRVVRNVVRGADTSTKGKRRRSVPMASSVAAALAELRDETARCGPGDLVFADPLTGAGLARTPLMRRYRHALDAAGLDVAFRFHDLRHTFGTTMASAGKPRRTIQEWMGHQSGETTEIYMHYAPAHDDADSIERAFAVADPRSSAPQEVAAGRMER